LVPEIDFTYFFTPNLSAEQILTYPQKHDVEVGGIAIGTITHLPPVLTAQWHFLPGAVASPYVGVGSRFSQVRAAGGAPGYAPRMCTLAVSLRSDRRWPVLVAANRDERLGRPAEGWALREPASGPRYAAPRDLQAGGTWIGVSAAGVFAGLTNFHAPVPGLPDPSRRSRGELVPLALAWPDAAAAAAALGRLAPSAFNPFHLLVADGRDAFLWWYDGEAAALEPLGPGLHLVTETSPTGLGPRGDLARARWPVDPSPARLRELLSTHEAPGQAPLCIHREPAYGTRSAAVLRLSADLEHAELYEADGHPCTSPLEDRSALLQALARHR